MRLLTAFLAIIIAGTVTNHLRAIRNVEAESDRDPGRGNG